jgi:iron complex outermembrane receptor protein
MSIRSSHDVGRRRQAAAIGRVVLGAALIISVSTTGFAQADKRDLGGKTLEELMNIRVTSVARKGQRAEDVAAAVFVITRKDISRSGLTTLPEVLRLAPGVQVAQVNGNKWAVSIRGFNDLFANKLLVLIDGRSVYNRAFGGVFWDAQDVPLSDIERIEVIRGPGGAMWGANAVNGVVNVITRSAADTSGLAFDLGAGTLEHDRIGVRYGGAIGQAAYRVFSQWSGYGDAQTAAGLSADDRWNSLTAGFRTDWTRAADALMTQAHYTGGTSRPRFLKLSSPSPTAVISSDGVASTDEVSALGRWTRTRATGTVFQVQAFNTIGYRTDTTFRSRERTSDVDLQFDTTAGARQAIVAGGGYRNIDLSTRDTFTLSIAPENSSIENAFLQDEITLRRAVTLTVGSKIEHDTNAGWGLLPSARVMWLPSAAQRAWAAVSRARRTPSASDRTLRINLGVFDGPGIPILAGFVGNPDYQVETLVETEAGYRVRIGSTAAMEIAVFRGTYDHLSTNEPLAPVFEATPAPAHLFAGAQLANLLNARTVGVEVNGSWSPVKPWRLNGSYSALRVSPQPDASSRDADASLVDGGAPRRQWQLRSTVSLAPAVQFDASLYYAGRLRRLEVPAYTRLDTSVELKLTSRLTAIASGRNLLQERHQEFSGALSAYVASVIPRSAHVQMRWQF